MRKADRETESRKLIGEKLREARMADNSPMTEADAEYYRILAEARATHASKENTRKSAKKHAFTSAAAILLILAVAGGSFILGMQSDVRASADPDDERKVVQQGDNIVKTYYNEDDIPDEIFKKSGIIQIEGLLFEKIKVKTANNVCTTETYYMLDDCENVIISTRTGVNMTNEFDSLEDYSIFEFDGRQIQKNIFNDKVEYRLNLEAYYCRIIVPNENMNIKIETILQGLEEKLK